MESNCEITRWTCDAFKNESFLNCDVEICGTSEKGDGYIGDITFVKVNAIKENGQRHEYDLVLKHGKKNETIRKTTPVRLAFEREIFVYKTVVPAFTKFQKAKNLEPIDFMAKCFNTLLYEKDEVIVFQNLRKIGYDLHDRFTLMNRKHLKLTLETYAKWHALSFAYRNQNLEDFNKIFQNLECVISGFYADPKIGDSLGSVERNVYETLEENGEFDLVKKLKDRFSNGFQHVFKELLKREETKSVLLHGDCWNNNMMFKYEDSDTNKTNPQKVALLDFQTSILASPVFDLSYHLYSVASKEEMEKFKDLLRIYYTAFSTYLRALGSDPEELFSYDDLVTHWKKYSTYGFIFALLTTTFALSEKENVIDVQDFKDSAIDDLIRHIKRTNMKEISSRTVNIVKHFLDFKDF